MPSPFQHNHGHIVTTSGKISIQDSGDETGVAPEEAGIATEIPLSPNAVTVQEEDRVWLPRMRELRDLATFMADDAVV